MQRRRFFLLSLFAGINIALGLGAAQAGINQWTTNGPAGRSVVAIVIDPTNPRILYAGTDKGVYKSTNAGAKWDFLPASDRKQINGLAIDPTNPIFLYATYNEQVPLSDGFTTVGGVLKSSDGGISWEKVLDLPPLSLCGALAVAVTTSITVYASCSDKNLAYTLFQSPDGGRTWQRITLPTTAEVRVFAVDPLIPTNIYAATGIGLFKSSDGGTHWRGAGALAGVHGGIDALALDPTTPSSVYASTQRGLFKSNDGGEKWTSLGLPFSAGSLVIDPIHPTTLYAGNLRSTDGGASWASIGTIPGVTSTLTIEPGTGKLYAGILGYELPDGTQVGGVYEFQLVGEPPPQIMATFENPEDRQIVSGIGMISGWALPTRENALFYSPTVFIDNERIAPPCCSEREDVQAAFPQFFADRTKNSGWSAVWNWGDLSSGVHTIQLVLSSEDGLLILPRRRVTVVKPGDFAFLDRFDLTGASASIAGEELLVDGIVIRDKGTQQQKQINARFRWFTNSQALGMVRAATLSHVASVQKPLLRFLTFLSWWDGLGFFIPTAQAAPAPTITSHFENPMEGQTVAGIGVLHGWAFAEGTFKPFFAPSIRSVRVTIDGQTYGEISCCSAREDVAAAFPESNRALASGWGMTVNYGDLALGIHTINVEIFPYGAASQVLSRTIHSLRIGGFPFVDRFLISQATAQIEGNDIVLSGVRVRDKASQQTKTTTIRLRWFEHTQSLGIVASSS